MKWVFLVCIAAKLSAQDCVIGTLERLSVRLGSPVPYATWAKELPIREGGVCTEDIIGAWHKYEKKYSLICVYTAEISDPGYKKLNDTFLRIRHQFDGYEENYSINDPVYIWIGLRFGGFHCALISFNSDGTVKMMHGQYWTGTKEYFNEVIQPDEFWSHTVAIIAIKLK